MIAEQIRRPTTQAQHQIHHCGELLCKLCSHRTVGRVFILFNAHANIPAKSRLAKMSKMELSNVVIEGLKSLNTVISIDLTKKIISNAVKVALHSDANIPSNPEIYASKPDYTKQAEYSVLTLMFLATKYELDNGKLRELLDQHGVSALAIEELISVYEKSLTSLRIKNLTTGLSLPHVTNVEWKLTCDVKSSQLDTSTGSVHFRINLGRYKELTGERETVAEFVCNAEELQFLIGRLKEIERHCDRVSAGK